ncbi:MAG: glutamate-1-semialdehyde 2,1-aminomutase [Clostridia bacterium]|jgi:glutamate-1-semialdehyde 2,1-aminomutase|nr:glutamate-1-semialdehyde 2,1-aminomutase [Clostridia bacterium]MCI2000483.1 glutamate-1-semialdehyde 2,1-aminomutase [Clostridia bacterium]MCI2014938.1 glutamate-1-semialdehyde 2,1-aminomutase [Clostridia bacterium]
MKTEISEKYFEEAKTLMPGGVNSPVRAFNAVGRTPLFIKKAKGSKIYDEDGNEFIDYVCSWGPGILGHARDEVIEAVKEACNYGLSYGAPTKKESVLAKMIRECIPHMEMMRMVSSGTEATMSAIRAARGFTGRDMIIKFAGCYHGHSDGLLVKSGSGLLSNAAPDSAGVPKGYSETTLVAFYNDEESVKKLFEKYSDKIACVIVEPVAANMGVVLPKKGFLNFLRDITKKYGALLIFDEVITGFRLSLGGASQYFGVTPDMTTLGKIVGGGMPVGVYGGRKEIMECISPLGKVYQAGTLSGNPIAMTAGIKTLELLMNDSGIYDRIDKKAAEIEKAFLKTRLVKVNRAGSLMSAFFSEKDVTDYNSSINSDTKKYADYFSHMLENGIYVAPSQFEAMFVSDAHTDEDIKKTCDVILSYKG